MCFSNSGEHLAWLQKKDITQFNFKRSTHCNLNGQAIIYIHNLIFYHSAALDTLSNYRKKWEKSDMATSSTTTSPLQFALFTPLTLTTLALVMKKKRYWDNLNFAENIKYSKDRQVVLVTIENPRNLISFKFKNRFLHFSPFQIKQRARTTQNFEASVDNLG